jgi:hypothetical protein
MNAAMTASREGRRQQLHWTWRDRPKMIANLGYGEELWIEGGGLGPNSFSATPCGNCWSGKQWSSPRKLQMRCDACWREPLFERGAVRELMWAAWCKDKCRRRRRQVISPATAIGTSITVNYQNQHILLWPPGAKERSSSVFTPLVQ